ncbi:hypothetical protein NMY22_g8701 [Coprinellus aureogranulatus]|nr:hypothetical protein NMY22_g8701 [Coprinellus aureogranulatus]
MPATTRSSFVNDLVLLILEASDHWWPEDFTRLACVSPSWLFHVRKRIYACPSVGSFPASVALARALQENPDLLQFVSGLELQPILREHEATTTTAQICSIQYLLGMELKRIKLGGSLARQAQRFLNALAFPECIEEVVIDGRLQDSCWMPCRSGMEWDGLLHRFPSLRKLKLANLELDIIPPSNSQSHITLTHFTLDNVDIAEGFLCHIIGGASVNTLSISVQSSANYDEQVRLVLDNCSVQTLEYQVRANKSSWAPSFLHGDAIPLNCLRLDGYIIDRDSLQELTIRCPSLQELVIHHRNTSITSQLWTDFISSGALPSLARLELSGGTHAWTTAEILKFERASKANRILLSF